MQLIEELYKISAPSGHEQEITQFITSYISNIPHTNLTVDEIGNIFVTKGLAKSYPCFASHLDEVHDFKHSDFQVMNYEGLLFGFSKSRPGTVGIGADDKNGIYILLRLLEDPNIPVLKCAFFVGEETGCEGSIYADLSFFDNCNFIIEPDRRGGNDFITNGAGTELCKKTFYSRTGAKKFGYKPTNGSITDVVELKQRGLEIATANISCGYYNPHTDSECTDFNELLNALQFCKHITQTVTSRQAHKPTESHGRRYTNHYYNFFDHEDFY